MRCFFKVFSCLLFILTLAFSALLISSCDPGDEKISESEPYLYIHTATRYPHEVQKWVVVTNGNGEVVGYKKLDAAGEESVLKERTASLHDKMNVYVISISENETGTSVNRVIEAVLGVEPGQHYYYDPNFVEGPTPAKVNANLYGIPNKSLLFAGSGDSGYTQKDLNGADGVIDSTKMKVDVYQSKPCPIIVYTRESPKYVNVPYGATGLQEFSYPEDFLEFDHVINVPTGQKPAFAFLNASSDGRSDLLLALIGSFDMEKVEANQSIKLYYNDGYDDYQTSYRIGNNGFVHSDNTPPSASEAVIPVRSLTVTGKNLYGFSASFPVEIDYRTSTYGFSETIGSTFYQHTIEVTANVNGTDKFDLELPDEFITANGAWDFNDFIYSGTTFYEFVGDKNFSQAVDSKFNVPDSYIGMSFYHYFAN